MIYRITSWKELEKIIKFNLLLNQGQPYFFMENVLVLVPESSY